MPRPNCIGVHRRSQTHVLRWWLLRLQPWRYHLTRVNGEPALTYPAYDPDWEPGGRHRHDHV